MRTSSHRLMLAVCLLLTGSVAAFVPFADVEELRPQQLHKFCDPEVKAGIRHCEGRSHRTLEDGGIVGLKWAMHADPDRILSLDLAKEHGVKLIKCTPSSLEIILPQSHAKHARVGELIVASHFVHGCEHLMNIKDEDKLGDEPANQNLYHRVVKVSSLQWKNADGSDAAGSETGKMAHAKLWTRELPSLGHAIGSMTYDFEYTPPEAVDESSWPKRRTWDGEDFHHGKWVEKPTARHLQDMQPFTSDQYNDNGARYEKGPYDNARDNPSQYEAYDRDTDDRTRRYNPANFQRPTDQYQGSNPNSDIRYRVDGGHPTLGGSVRESDDVKSMLNFRPKRVANFGWNWDFKVNASQDLSFNYTVPGSKMMLIVKKPYIKAHSALRIRFRSYMPNENAEDTFFTDNTWVSLTRHTSGEHASIFDSWEPRVKWEAAMPGHGALELGILMQANAQTRISSNPLEMIQIPVLQQFWKPKWFGTLDFSLGSFPVSITPGIQFKAKFFHYGSFRGSLSVGLRTFPRYNPKLQFDSFTGLNVDFKAKLRETTITPPNWLVSTSHFECGLALEPTIWIKGHMGKSTVNTRFAAALRPYFNMTITRAGSVSTSVTGDNQKSLIIYPFRVTGLTPTDSNKNMRYKVRITTKMDRRHCTQRDNGYEGANNQAHYDSSNPTGYTAYSGHGNDLPDCNQYKRRIDSTESISWGDIAFQDPVDRFNFGVIAQRMLFYLHIDIQLVQVDYSSGKPFERASSAVTVRCKTVMNGVCQPSPVVEPLRFMDSNVQVYAHMVWKDNPASWFGGRIRGVAASVPEVIINKDYIAQVDPDFSINSYMNQGITYGSNTGKPLVLVLQHEYKSYPILVNKQNGYVPGMNSSSMKSDDVLELGASFLSSWDRSCQYGATGCDPKVTLYYGGLELASANLPPIPWNSGERSSSSYQSVFGSEAYRSRIIPVSVALQASFERPDADQVRTLAWNHVGLVRLKFAVSNPASWNRWIRPYAFTSVPVGSTYKLVWTLNNADPLTAKQFTVILMKGQPATTSGNPQAAASAANQKYLRQRVGRTWFEQISSEAVGIKPINVAGVHRTRFEHDISFGGMNNGDQIMAIVQWTDKLGNLHSMNAPPFVIEPVKEQAKANVATGATVAPSNTLPPALQPVQPGGRRLNWFSDLFNGGNSNGGWEKGADGQWVSKHQVRHNRWQDRRTCARKDLNFAFGAGIEFRAYVQHLSLPKDLPVLGAIQSAPELGLPWQTITGWESKPTDLASKLPALLCRHGVCSAALPGCSEYNTVQHYYPEVSIHFKKTLRYPQGKDKLKAKNQWIEVLRQALSFTFATLPQFIQIVVHYTSENPPKALVQQPKGQQHRRRFAQYHNVMSGIDACENRGYTVVQCASLGCCQYDASQSECHSAVGTGPCYKNTAPGFLSSVTLGDSNATLPPVGTLPPLNITTPPPLPAVPLPAITEPTALPPTPAPVPAPAPGVAPGPVITPLGGSTKRRLDDGAQTVTLDRKELDAAGLHEPRVQRISVRFRKGLKYEVDDKLLEAMIKEGLFQQLEEAPTADEPLRVHSAQAVDLNPDSHPNDDSAFSEVLQSPQRMLLVGAVACGTLLGVAFVVRRARSSYQRVEEDTLLQGPVE